MLIPVLEVFMFFLLCIIVHGVLVSYPPSCPPVIHNSLKVRSLKAVAYLLPIMGYQHMPLE